MNSFGLGLVLNFVDNASAGMNSATANFNRMSATADSLTSSVNASATEMAAIAFSLSAVGDTFTSIGSSIMGVFTGITQKVIDTGGQMQGYRMQMAALYGSMEAGEAKMEEIKSYAMSSVFEISSLIPAVTMMKAVGIEALDEITTSSGSATQKLIDYASDLAAMMPNMRNVYGTGVEAAMGAFKEYIAEGNAMSLKRGAGLDITAILGEEKGSSIEERTQQVADLIDKLNIVGYTAQLAGTPTQRLSNMQDALFNSLSKIADSGVFEVYCGLLETLSDWVFSLVNDEEAFNTITGVLAETISTLLSPLQKMLDWVVANSEAIIDWIKENPKLVKNILLTVAAVGAFLIVGGSLLKLLSSIAFAMSGLSVLRSLPLLFGKMTVAVLPFVALASIAYTAWDKNLGGIRDKITWLVNNIGDIFTVLGDAWGDNTLSEENFVKAKQLGILPFIEGILQLKYYWDFFVEGFKNGFKSFFSGLVEFFGTLGIDVETIIGYFGDFLKSLTEVGAEDKWTAIGESLGKTAGALITILAVVQSLKGIINAVSGAFKVFAFIFKPISIAVDFAKNLGKVLKDVINVLKGGGGVTFFGKLVEVIKAVVSGGISLKDALTVVFGAVGTTIAGVISVISGVVMAAVGFVKQLTEGFSWFWEIIKWVGIALGVVGAIILGVAAWPAVIVGAIIGALTTIIVLVKQYWNEIGAFLSKIGSWVYDNVIKPVADFFVNLWVGIVTGVTNAFNAVKNFLITIASWVYNNVIAPVVNFFMTYIFPIIAKIVEIVAKIIEIVVTLVRVFVQWVYNNVITPIVNFFVGLWNTIVSGVQSFVEKVMNVVSIIVGWINENIVTPIAEFFSSLWTGIVEGVTSFIESVKEVFLTIVSWIQTNIIDPIANFFAGLWESITVSFGVISDTISSILKGAINTVLGFIVGVINGVISGINFAIGIINAIPGVSITKITELSLPQLAEGGVATDATTAIIGEGKDDEAILPLNAEVFNEIAKGISKQAPIAQSNSTQSQGVAPVQNDYSVTFAAGSVVIQLSNSSDAELERAAEKIMKIIARKQQLRSMSVRA